MFHAIQLFLHATVGGTVGGEEGVCGGGGECIHSPDAGAGGGMR